MTFEDIIFNEDLRISSGEEALDNLFKRYMSQVFSPMFLKKINRFYNTTLVLKDFKQRSNVMCYTQGTKIYLEALDSFSINSRHSAKIESYFS